MNLSRDVQRVIAVRDRAGEKLEPKLEAVNAATAALMAFRQFIWATVRILSRPSNGSQEADRQVHSGIKMPPH